ncbi:hypothetical protein CDD80_4529 [Ophiocordyceps camponoti-rufipedis]|uniref:Uncharacterized protein n=1 Tax=Ophiocordyceps camponoti-rufipedis TaxID=2004952 RepID=A0A2C5ZIF7_9HYPO|nr:hypothetical protein CDD80_4529 [Ophiocordyceps camponoti-rufipedis]
MLHSLVVHIRLFLTVILAIFFFLILHDASRRGFTWTVAHKMARQTTPSALLHRRPAAHSNLPTIFHQSWMTTELPAKFQRWSATCREAHPRWEWVIWTDDDNLRLVQRFFPSLETTYRHLPGEIYRADLSRALYIVYADLDTECLLPTEQLKTSYPIFFDNRLKTKALFGRMGTDPDFAHSIPNAWMASTPGHPFFLHFLQTIDDRTRDITANNKSWPSAEGLTGPVALREAIAKYEEEKVRRGSRLKERVAQLVRDGPFDESDDENEHDHRVFLLPSSVVYPYSWWADGESVRPVCWVLSEGFNAERCKEVLQVGQAKSISITYWSHTHTPTGHSDDNLKHIQG